MLDSLGAIKELYEASKGGEVLAAINHAAKMTTSTLPFTGFSRSQIRSIPTRYDVVWLQGGLDPNKISGLGVDFGHLVRCLLLGNKDAACKPSMIFR